MRVAGSYRQCFPMPIGAKVLTVQVQHGIPVLWAEVDTKAEKEERCFEIFGTGNEMPEDMGVERRYICTIQMPGSWVVLHFYERLN